MRSFLVRAPLLLYRWFFSPIAHLLVGAGYGCRFEPSCSRYAERALQTHGLLRGGSLVLSRLFRCHPFSTGGFDPVPACGIHQHER